MDTIFIVKMLGKHCSHLQAQEKNINTLVEDYDRQISSLSKLDPKKYGWRVKELEDKKNEAFIKLSHVCPNIEKILEQMEILSKNND